MNQYCEIKNDIVRKAVMEVLKGTGLAESSNAGQSTIYIQDDRWYGEVLKSSVIGSNFTKVSIEEMLDYVENLGQVIQIGNYNVTFDKKGDCEAAGVKFTYKVVKEIVDRLKSVSK